MSGNLNNSVLVLNSNWAPISVTTVKKAIKLVFTEGARFVDTVSYQLYDWADWEQFYPDSEDLYIRGVSRDYMVPEVVTLSKFDNLPSSIVTFSRRNVFKRDKFTCQYCLDPKHKILTADLHWVPIGDLVSGDALVGFEETASKSRRKYTRSIVESHTFDTDYKYKVVLDDGQEFQVTEDHLWLAKTSPKAACKWIETSNLLGCYIPKLFDVCSADKSYESGWLSGILDGEGWLHTGNKRGLNIGVAQNPGYILDRIRRELLNQKFNWGEGVVNAGSPCIRIVPKGGNREAIRLLSLSRPERLISKFDPAFLGTVKSNDWKKVISIEPVGKGEIVKMKTSTGTFIADGFPHHNCGTQPDRDDLTIDHIVPRSRNGGSNWTNCVLSCTNCNFKKANRTPEEAHMKLRNAPSKPVWKPLYSKNANRLDSWKNFINEAYWDTELESD